METASSISSQAYGDHPQSARLRRSIRRTSASHGCFPTIAFAFQLHSALATQMTIARRAQAPVFRHGVSEQVGEFSSCGSNRTCRESRPLTSIHLCLPTTTRTQDSEAIQRTKLTHTAQRIPRTPQVAKPMDPRVLRLDCRPRLREDNTGVHSEAE